jgi:short-subunit dehydrogenase
MKTVVAAMRRRSGGSIINIPSVAGLTGSTPIMGQKGPWAC